MKYDIIYLNEDILCLVSRCFGLYNSFEAVISKVLELKDENTEQFFLGKYLKYKFQDIQAADVKILYYYNLYNDLLI